jgi:hypothetical protein
MGAVGKVSTTVLKLSISLKTAKALGLTIPTPLRGDSMADISEFSIITYERKPGCWRAAITRKAALERSSEATRCVAS